MFDNVAKKLTKGTSTQGVLSDFFEPVTKSRVFADEDGATAVYLNKDSGTMRVICLIKDLGGVDVPAYDVPFSDFDIVYMGDYFNIPN